LLDAIVGGGVDPFPDPSLAVARRQPGAAR
jgi:hypothetical protein